MASATGYLFTSLNQINNNNNNDDDDDDDNILKFHKVIKTKCEELSKINYHSYINKKNLLQCTEPHIYILDSGFIVVSGLTPTHEPLHDLGWSQYPDVNPVPTSFETDGLASMQWK